MNSFHRFLVDSNTNEVRKGLLGMKNKNKTDNFLHTYTGLCINIVNPKKREINIEDIAHALSNVCRFGGRVNKFYSVAEHSVRVSHLCEKEHALWGLLHDASEAYLVDIPRPIKKLDQMSGYMELESMFMNVVCEKFNLDSKMPEIVNMADNILLATEKRDLLNQNEVLDKGNDIQPLEKIIKPWSPKKAKRKFLKRFEELTKKDKG